MEDYKGAIAARVKAYVKDKNTTKDAIADALQIGRSSFYDRLNGKRPWLLDEARELSKMLDCSIDELLTMPSC